MSDDFLNLKTPPIVEAVLDIDCDMPVGLDFEVLQTSARQVFTDRYPKSRTQFIQAVQVEAAADRVPNVTARQGIQALLLLQEDEKQLVQVRPQGFSFNRLAPYTSLDDYMPEIKRAWHLFLGLVPPAQVRVIRLRYINRFLIPSTDSLLDLDQYLKLGPGLPNDGLVLTGFLHQHSAADVNTGNKVNIILTGQSPENGKLSIILDIEAFSVGSIEPDDWMLIQSKIQSLRQLKNTVFHNSLTPQCLQMFQQ